MESVGKTDAVLGGYEMPVKLEMFEGPLDLLLFLIRKSEIDIYDIPISEITEQYMTVLRSLGNIEVAGEFFVMAASLMYIKSRMLLPSDERATGAEEIEDDDIDPRWQLVEQLLEYKKIKQAATSLDDLIELRQRYLGRRIAAKDLELPRPLMKSDKMELWTVFNLVLRNLAEKLVEGRIVEENITVSERMELILARGAAEKKFTFTSLFEGGKAGIKMLVATFLAMLELTRLRRLSLVQGEAFDEIYCEFLPEEEKKSDTDIGESES